GELHVDLRPAVVDLVAGGDEAVEDEREPADHDDEDDEQDDRSDHWELLLPRREGSVGSGAVRFGGLPVDLPPPGSLVADRPCPSSGAGNSAERWGGGGASCAPVKGLPAAASSIGRAGWIPTRPGLEFAPNRAIVPRDGRRPRGTRRWLASESSTRRS